MFLRRDPSQMFDVVSDVLSIRQDNLSIKSRNTSLLNIGRVSLISFVTINLLEEFSWFLLDRKEKAFIRAHTKYTN